MSLKNSRWINQRIDKTPILLPY